MPEKVRQSAKRISEEGELVTINEGRLSACADALAERETPVWDEDIHYKDGTEKTLMFVLLLDAVNFCFWPETFTIEHRGKIYGEDDGYPALAIALTRAFEDGTPLWDAQYLSRITLEEFGDIMRFDGTIPLLFKRLDHARNLGSTLLEHYGGSPVRLLEECGRHAPTLARRLGEQFACYGDSRTWRGERVDILKRAQLCAADIADSFPQDGIGSLTGMDDLTCFADYKLPQLFHNDGVFEYAKPLEKAVVTGDEIAEDSVAEVEIRANTIHAVELLKGLLAKRGRAMSARTIDWMLWNESIIPGRLSVPHHKTRTASY